MLIQTRCHFTYKVLYFSSNSYSEMASVYTSFLLTTTLTGTCESRNRNVGKDHHVKILQLTIVNQPCSIAS